MADCIHKLNGKFHHIKPPSTPSHNASAIHDDILFNNTTDAKATAPRSCKIPGSDADGTTEKGTVLQGFHWAALSGWWVYDGSPPLPHDGNREYRSADCYLDRVPARDAVFGIGCKRLRRHKLQLLERRSEKCPLNSRSSPNVSSARQATLVHAVIGPDMTSAHQLARQK